MSIRVAILLSGGGSNMVSLVDSMTGDHPARPVLVLSNNADAGGLEKAAARGVTTAVVDHRLFKGDRDAFDAEIHEILIETDVDLICYAGFMRIQTAGFMTLWQGRTLNIHPSLLPKYPGLNTHARALAAGDKEAGCSVHEVIAELDSGPLQGQIRVPVLPDDTAETLAARVLKAEHRLYPAVLRRFVTGERQPLFLA